MQLEKLRSVIKDLKELEKICKRQKETHFFEEYYQKYLMYMHYHSLVCELITQTNKKKDLKDLEFKISKLSDNQIKDLDNKGKHDAVLGNHLLNISEYSKKLASFLQKIIALNNNILKAEAYLKDASNETSRASTLINKLDFNGSVEASQHSIEHSIKSLFRLVGIEHPFKHDPTEKFEAVVEKLELQKYDLTSLARIRWLAQVWATIHHESMYPFRNISAKEFFNVKDAEILHNYADEVYRVSSRLVNGVKYDRIRISFNNS